MAHVITQNCIGTKAAACTAVCPVDCIHPRKDEPDYETVQHLSIDPGTCIDCGLCVEECPPRAIFPEAAVPGEWNNFIQLNKDYFANKT